jgi:dTDP-4-amino-4,6-dideoxygalactose transaminase
MQSHGAGQALEVIFASLVSPQSNVLLPRPGFHQYETLLANIGAECRFYDCVEENDWEIDLASLESLIDENSAMILIVSPITFFGYALMIRSTLRTLAAPISQKPTFKTSSLLPRLTSSPSSPMKSTAT